MDSPIDESDLGSLSHRRTSLEVEREGNRKGSPSLCLLLAAFLVHPALRRLQIQLQIGRPKPEADTEIKNQRRTPAIRRRHTEEEEQKIQHNKGQTKGLREGRSESIRMETGRRGTDSEKEEAWHEIGGGRISDSELLDSMDGGRALQLKHEINVESTIIQRGTTTRDRDQPLVYRVPNLRFFKYPIPEEFQPLLPLGRVSLLSELAGREDQLINMNLESGWLIAASLYWRLSGRGGACYRNLFPGVNLVRSILREKKDGNEWEDWSSLFISRKELVSTSLIRRTNKKRLTV
ncbi:hypothetical protein Tco_0858278 [Tanacetum coccineum]|uniref:Uncharacterized protein n=1 Tax=Tanacetum coccineum TaxID=301880 RepID=A0ABQ5BCH7_9ASTR